MEKEEDENEEETTEENENEEEEERWSRDKVQNIKNKVNKNKAVIKYYFQNTVSSIIHVSNSSKQFLNRPYL